MDRLPSTPRRLIRGRPRGRPPAASSITRSSVHKPPFAGASEPPPKRRKYIPGGPGGGGRFIDDTGMETSAESAGPATAPRPRVSTSNIPTPVYPRRERSARIRTAVNREESEDVQYSSAAAVAAAVVQSEGYKPREERGWEEFHPNLDIEATFMIFSADEVDGTAKSAASTPIAQRSDTPREGTAAGSSKANTPTTQGKPTLEETFLSLSTPKRRVGRPSRDSVTFYGPLGSNFGQTPRTPKVLPIHNQTPKERLDLKQPSYRKTDRILLFESKTFGQARYVDKSMMNVGYQESDNFIRPDRHLIKATDTNVDEELDPNITSKTDSEQPQHSAGVVGRVEYDMDEQDDMWLAKLNAQRKTGNMPAITREVFEIAITKIEKEWHALEKRIPKPNPKPPQTHRPRSSSAAAVNGEPHAGEEQDSKCAICDDGDCENTNAIVFCDGCDLAVHQECYGVPFIPEGQWLCRKCQLIGRGIPTCIFCPNTDGAFKQTNSSKWAHLLCAMWIPEVSLGNHTFMEPVMEVEKVPKNRWKLSCYICNQRMGACIQCSNKNCYQAFHVTCARRGRLYLKMKNAQGALAVLDGSMLLKAFCDKHCPPDYAKENSVVLATKDAKRFYKRTMRGRIWADSQASALQLAATHRHALTEHPPDESQMTGAKVSAVLADKKKGQPGKPIWKLPSGAPIIPQAVYDIVEGALQRFPIIKRKEFVAEACRYWTLKREARRGAALLKRLQLQMETFSSMELTRRNFAAMGPSGKARLARRIEFAQGLIKDLEQLKALSDDVVEREIGKLEAAEMEQDFVDSCYFPVYRMLLPVVEKAFALDKNIFNDGLVELQNKLDERYYATTLAFAHDLCEVIHVGINGEPKPIIIEPRFELIDISPTKQSSYSEIRDRKRLGKRILKSVQPQLEAALKAEADISNKPLDTLLKELDGMLDASLEMRRNIAASNGDMGNEDGHDAIMADAPEEAQIIVADQLSLNGSADEDGGAADKMDIDDEEADADHSIEVNTSDPDETAKDDAAAKLRDQKAAAAHHQHDRVKQSDSPPSLNGYAPPTAPPTIVQPAGAASAAHDGPLTPPQSNGSLAGGPADVLNEGGLPWYLKGFELAGTTAVEERWAGRDAVRRALSEDLTDMDDEALKDLEFDVDDERNGRDDDDEEEKTITASTPPTVKSRPVRTPASGKRRAATVGQGSAGSSAGKFRKGIRSSARKR